MLKISSMRHVSPHQSYANLHFRRMLYVALKFLRAKFAESASKRSLFELHPDPAVGPSVDSMYIIRPTNNLGWWGQSKFTEL